MASRRVHTYAVALSANATRCTEWKLQDLGECRKCRKVQLKVEMLHVSFATCTDDSRDMPGSSSTGVTTVAPPIKVSCGKLPDCGMHTASYFSFIANLLYASLNDAIPERSFIVVKWNLYGEYCSQPLLETHFSKRISVEIAARANFGNKIRKSPSLTVLA